MQPDPIVDAAAARQVTGLPKAGQVDQQARVRDQRLGERLGNRPVGQGVDTEVVGINNDAAREP
jgi:hypothetical protein